MSNFHGEEWTCPKCGGHDLAYDRKFHYWRREFVQDVDLDGNVTSESDELLGGESEEEVDEQELVCAHCSVVGGYEMPEPDEESD
jgi:hypothetical protein